MGSTALLDIIGSSIIGGLLLLAALRMNDSATTNTFHSQEQLTVQENMTSLVNNLEYDFRKIGYASDPTRVPQSNSMILLGDTTRIRFLAQLDANGSLDTVEWYLGTDSSICANPHVKMLYRRVASPTAGSVVYASNLGVRQFSLLYFTQSVANGPIDTLNTPFYSPTLAKLIEIDLRVEPTSAYDTAYSSTFSVWRQIRLTSMNLVNR